LDNKMTVMLVERGPVHILGTDYDFYKEWWQWTLFWWLLQDEIAKKKRRFIEICLLTLRILMLHFSSPANCMAQKHM
jgi:hypothetical protein